jgi:methyltransferase OMS1
MMGAVGGGTVVFVGSMVLLNNYMSPVKLPEVSGVATAPNGEGGVEASEARRRRLFDALAPCYDRKLELDEMMTGVGNRRRDLMRHARGDVLEVGGGTGRNIMLYPLDRCRHITITDQSIPMLHVASQALDAYIMETVKRQKAIAAKLAKAKTTQPTTPATTTPTTTAPATLQQPTTEEEFRSRFTIKAMSIDHLDFKDNTFDTVVDTFGLCSYADPVQALHEMSRVCKKESGLILLLEHGTTDKYFGIVNKLIKTTAPRHLERWGCWYDRDIKSIVVEAGLEVIHQDNFHLGTGYYIIARPHGAKTPLSPPTS